MLVALAIRLGYMWQFQHIHPRQGVSVIPFLFESGNIAHSLATGHGFSSPFRVDTGPTAWMTPLFPLLLAGIIRLFGAYTFQAWAATVLLNITCCTIACIPIYFTGRLIDGIRLAAGAAWLWAIFPNAILLPVESMWDASVSALLAATILWATLALAESQRLRDWCAYGLLWGIALMFNATLAALFPFLAGWLVYRARQEWRRSVRNAAAAVAIIILCCVPWTVRNYRVFHQFVPLRSVLGLQLWLGNNDQTEHIFRGDLHPIYNASERDKYIAMGEIAYMRQKKQQAIAYIFSHPAREASLITYRAISIWSGGTPYPLQDFLGTPGLRFRAILAFNLVAALGTLCGIIILFRERRPCAVPVAAFPLVYPWAYYLTLALPRYRLPIDPIVLLLLAISIQRVAQKLARPKSSATETKAQTPARYKRKKTRATA
ncbi:MAG TPA: glycosyltransferase family 39 protein [Candidatus Acidoferrales bacterium]|jgi:4-amino-4-deoxy-L-arabinose transferase-like glycosyltransferase|nr:glycosyltransferase family 39 protein [Candidatus Acidoferrales bacterium]